MEEVGNAPSNGADDTALPDAVENTAPVPSIRDALSSAFDKAFKDDDTRPDRPRDDAGRFAPKTDAPAKPVEAKPAEAAPEAQPTTEQPVTPVDAPSRFTPAAKAAFASAPPELQAEIRRLETETTKGIETYKAAYEPVRRFDDMARQSGTTLERALEGYVGMENMLRSDPVKGMLAICQNAGIDPQAMAQALSGQPSQGGASPEVAAMQAHIRRLEEQVQGVGRTITERDVLSQVQSFAKDRPRFDELSGDIARILQTGFASNLAEAYEIADRLKPAPVAAPAPAPASAPVAVPAMPDPAQTRKASLSITGSPTGSSPSSRSPAGSAREAVQRALSQVGM
jgi:hypothetical protein